MRKFNYLKFYNSDTTTMEYWNKLTLQQQKKVKKLAEKLEQDLIKFKNNADIVYSLMMHLLENKIDFKEETITTTQIIPKQKNSTDTW